MPAIDDVYRKFGEAAEAAQLLETELGNMLLAARCLDEGLLENKNPTRATDILASVNRYTRGQRLKNLNVTTDSLDALDALWSEALQERNRLFHSFYRKHNFRRNSDEGRILMLHDFDAIHSALLDAYKASLDQFKGLNQTGDVGLRDQVNNHYLRIFGVSLAIGALGAVAQGGTTGPLTASGTDLMRQGFAQSTAQSSAQILDKFLNIMPTVTIREGRRVKVYLSGDLALPDYNNHKLPSDL